MSVESAEHQAAAWVVQVADARGWGDDWRDLAFGIIAASADAPTEERFWSSLVNLWSQNAEAAAWSGEAAGWDKLGATFASAAGETEYQGAGWGDIAKGTASGIWDDIVGITETTRKAGQGLGSVAAESGTIADPRKSWVPWVVGGAAVVAGYIWVVRPLLPRGA